MEVRIEKLDNLGRGITYINDKICFIENTLPGEIVEVQITKDNKKYLEAMDYVNSGDSRALLFILNYYITYRRKCKRFFVRNRKSAFPCTFSSENKSAGGIAPARIKRGFFPSQTTFSYRIQAFSPKPRLI